MLDNVTKRRIDTARDILVGKVPDPKSQVEQITIALIYKFMDDMDAQAEEMGGKRSFFSGKHEKYGWAKLMSLGKGGHEVLNLYGEAITTMNQNEGIPPLFRDIFKNAYLPYRDPETLKSFLKIINDFEYDHSERLGDAFEYLLSVLGSQGDAGQFRTPRHIIDFMVEVIDPKKDESILDPACGTAGFLISSWKHVLQANSKDGRKGAGLTPDERKRLIKNIKGYDISPDMVRLSLVNLYLHGFTDPHISEYDTLTSEDNWNEYSDIIMANPPFMSPKGGIKPHKRFSVQAKRSEVLFVDYIAEHLTPNGRAAVIVPEGIIFQSQNAYKQLRQMLVENYLYAVVSLPAGVFQPYSGVKTSILLMDKTLTKKCDSILFVKIENDGFDLGAQRREIEKNDLPEAKQALQAFHQACVVGNEEAFNPEQFANVLKVEKEKIGEKGEWNLSGERYRENDELLNSDYELVELGVIAEFKNGLWKGKKEPFVNINIIRNTNFTKTGQLDLSDVAKHLVEIKQLETRQLEYGDIILENSGGGPTQPVGRVVCFDVIDGETYSWSNFTSRIRVIDKKVNFKYLFLILNDFYQRGKTEPFQKRTSGIRNLDKKAYQQIKTPLPPLKIQEEIVAEIEGYQKIIDGARVVVKNYKPQIQINPEWEIVKLGDVIEFVSGLTLSIPECEDSDGVPIIAINNVTEAGELTLTGLRRIKLPNKKTINYLKKGDLLFNWRNGSKRLVGKTALFNLEGDYVFASFLLGIRTNKVKLLTEFLWYLLNIYRSDGKYMQFMRENVNGLFNREELKILIIPLPSIETQTQIVTQIEKEQALVNANKELITLFEQKIKDKIASVWGE